MKSKFINLFKVSHSWAVILILLMKVLKFNSILFIFYIYNQKYIFDDKNSNIKLPY